MHKIYEVSNLGATNDIYIGCTQKSLNQRFKVHLNDMKKRSYPFYVWLKTNSSIAKIKLIEEVEIEAWQNREKYWIAFYRQSDKNVLNIADGGKGTPGVRTSRMLGKKHTEEAKNKIKRGLRAFLEKTTVHFNANRVTSGETKLKISNSLKGRNVSEATKLKMSGAFKGRKYDMSTPAQIQRINKLKIEVNMLDLNGNYIKSFRAIDDAAKYVSGFRTNICACCRGKQKSAYGYKWVY